MAASTTLCSTGAATSSGRASIDTSGAGSCPGGPPPCDRLVGSWKRGRRPVIEGSRSWCVLWREHLADGALEMADHPAALIVDAPREEIETGQVVDRATDPALRRIRSPDQVLMERARDVRGQRRAGGGVRERHDEIAGDDDLHDVAVAVEIRAQ